MSSSEGPSDCFAPTAPWPARRTKKWKAPIARDMGLINGRLDELTGVTNDMNAKLDTIIKALAQLSANDHINIPLTEATIQVESKHTALRASLARMEDEMGSLLPSPKLIQMGPRSTAEPESECALTTCESYRMIIEADDVMSKCKSYEAYKPWGLKMPSSGVSSCDEVDHDDDFALARFSSEDEIPLENRPPRVPPIAIGHLVKQGPGDCIPGRTPRGLEVCQAYNAQTTSLFEGCRGGSADPDLERLLKMRLERSEGRAVAAGAATAPVSVAQSPRWHFTPRGSLQRWLSTSRSSHTSRQLYRMQPADVGVPETLESIPLA